VKLAILIRNWQLTYVASHASGFLMVGKMERITFHLQFPWFGGNPVIIPLIATSV